MVSRLWMRTVVGGACAGALVVGTVSAASAASVDTWCKNIEKGLYCAPLKTPPPAFCGTKKISVALADGFADNPWRQQATAAAINEASRCSNVTSWTHTDGEGNTQKSISDLEGLAARGVNAIVVFADAGPAMLPAIREAYKEGSVVVPYRAMVGGKAGVDYSTFIGTDFENDGLAWGRWMAKALHGKGTVVYLGGPVDSSESHDKAKGLMKAFKRYPGIKWIGTKPYEVTNWNASLMAKTLSALISKYPKIDGVIADLSVPTVIAGAFERAHRPLPLYAGEDANGWGCLWRKVHKKNPHSTFQFMTTSAETWNVRLAIEYAIAKAAAGHVDQPLVIADGKGRQHVVAKPGRHIVRNFVVQNSLKGVTFCNSRLPSSAGNATSLTVPQLLGALKGGL